MDASKTEDAVLEHLHDVAKIKRGMLEVVRAIAADYPNQATLLINMIRELTRSADKLLGDTVVTEPPANGA